MAINHGNKRCFQVLLDPHRSQLLEEVAASQGVRATALIRDLLYEWVERTSDEEKFEHALVNDKLLWEQTVQKRLDGRAKARAARKLSALQGVG